MAGGGEVSEFKKGTVGWYERQREAREPITVGVLVSRLLGGVVSCDVRRSAAAVVHRGRGSGVWLSQLLTDGEAAGWALVYALQGGDNVANADHIIEAMRGDGLIRRGALAHDHSQAAFLGVMGGHGDHWRYPREYMWHLANGAGNTVLQLSEVAK